MNITWLDITFVSFIIILGVFWIKAIQAKRKIDSGEIEVRNIDEQDPPTW